MKSSKLIVAGSALVAALLVAPSMSADPSFEVAPVNQGALPGTLIHDPMAIKWNPEGGNKSVKIVESEGVPGSQAISFRVRRKNSKPWEIRMRAPFAADISAGEQIELYFWARAEKTPKNKDTGKIGVVLQRDEEPYDSVVNVEILPTTEWKMYRVAGTAERDFPADESDMGFNFGFEKQTIELGPFYAITRGSVSE